MPHLQTKIVRAYRQTGETGRIHYIVERSDGTERRLYADRDTNPALYRLLDEELQAQGYTGPKADPQAADR
jgi:hypothetical protein